MLNRIRLWARSLVRSVSTLWFALKDPATPMWAKAMAGLIVAYALSPIDLIPDFIPVLGMLDEMILLPGLIWLTLRMLPARVLTSSRAKAEQWQASGSRLPRSIFGATLMIIIWAAVAALAWHWYRQGSLWSPGS